MNGGITEMYYTLNDNIYIIEGATRGCIYDLNKSKLFSINKALSNKLVQMNKCGIEINSVDCDLEKILEQFVDMEIVKLSKTPSQNMIKDIKVDLGCKFAWIEITNKCNLKCQHCYNESDSHCDNIMSFTDFCSVVDNLVEVNVKKIQITGGEPFLNKDILKKMLDYVNGKFTYIEIFTNGTLITDEWFDYLHNNDIHIALSVYSYESKMHDAVTGVEGSFKNTNKTIENLRKYNIPYRVCNVLMKDIQLGDKNTDLYTLNEDKDVVRVTGRANLNLLSDKLIKKRLITKETFQKPIKKAFCQRLVSGHNCFNDKIYISANLDVFPCVMERRIKHCSLENGKKLILNDSIRNITKDKIKVCDQCEYRYACFDCRPNSLDKDIDEKPWYCTYDPCTGIWADINDFVEEIKTKLEKV